MVHYFEQRPHPWVVYLDMLPSQHPKCQYHMAVAPSQTTLLACYSSFETRSSSSDDYLSLSLQLIFCATTNQLLISLKIALLAYAQHRQTKTLHQLSAPKLNALLQSLPSTCFRRYSWTRTHTAFAIMGGFAFDTGGPGSLSLEPSESPRLILTTRALRLLSEYEPHLIPDVSEEDIKDKTRADGISKALACLQATWFCSQFIWRIGSRFPVTILEMYTFLHCLMMFVTYVFWWDKPKDCEACFLIPTTEGVTRELCAAMYLRSSMSVGIKVDPILTDPIYRGHMAVIELEEDARYEANTRFGQCGGKANMNPTPKAPGSRRDQPHVDSFLQRALDNRVEFLEEDGALILRPYQCRHGITFRHISEKPHRERRRCESRHPNPSHYVSPLLGEWPWGRYIAIPQKIPLGASSPMAVRITPSMVKLTEAAHNDIQRCEELRGVFVKSASDCHLPCKRTGIPWYSLPPTLVCRSDTTLTTASRPEHLVSGDKPTIVIDQLRRPRYRQLPNWKDFVVMEIEDWCWPEDSIRCYCTYAMDLLQGGFYLLAWNGPFRTHSELVLWRISALAIAINGFTLTLLFVTYRVIRDSRHLRQLREKGYAPTRRRQRFVIRVLNFHTKLVTRTWNSVASNGIRTTLLFLIWSLTFYTSNILFCGFIFIECIISLPYAPAGAFLQPSWPSYFPHYG